MSTDRMVLRAMLERVLEDLATLAEGVRDEAERQGIPPYLMSYSTGELAMAPIVTAQAQALAALVLLDIAGR